MSVARFLDRAVCKALQSRGSEPRYRVFKNNSLDYVSCRRIPEAWRRGEERSYDQLARLSGKNTFMAINEIAKWDAGLCRNIRRSIQKTRLLDGFCNAWIVDTYTFISSSAGWTPFGAHVDFEHSIIMDVAGEGRTIYTWDVGANIGQLKTDAVSFFGLSFDYHDYMKASRSHVLNPGDIFVIRKMEGHVFHAAGPGMFIGLSCVEGEKRDCKDPYGPELAPSRDAEILGDLQKNAKDKLCWLQSAEILEDKRRIVNASLHFKIDDNTVTIAKDLRKFLLEKSNSSFDSCIDYFLEENIDIKPLLCSCARIGAVYVL